MNILCINCDNPFSNVAGGQRNAVFDYIIPLTASHRVSVVTIGSNQGHANVASAEIISVGPERFGTRVGLIQFAKAARKFVATKGSQYDLIIELFTSPVGPLGLPALTDTPVAGYAAFAFWQEMGEKYHLPIARLARRILSTYAWLVAPDESVARDLRSAAPKAEVRVFPHYQTLGIPDINQEPLGDHLLYIGRSETHQKGLHLLLDALETVETADLTLEIVGFSAEDRIWRRLSRNRSLRCRVIFNGFVPPTLCGGRLEPGSQLKEALRRARAVAIPSRYESFGIVQLEAAALGVPSIAFDLPAFADRAEAILSVPQFDTAALSRAIDSAFRDNAMIQRLRGACALIAERFSPGDKPQEFQRFLEDTQAPVNAPALVNAQAPVNLRRMHDSVLVS
jgi:glycosyltransferase involved in cell wall biosynthesis